MWMLLGCCARWRRESGGSGSEGGREKRAVVSLCRPQPHILYARFPHPAFATHLTLSRLPFFTFFSGDTVWLPTFPFSLPHPGSLFFSLLPLPFLCFTIPSSGHPLFNFHIPCNDFQPAVGLMGRRVHTRWHIIREGPGAALFISLLFPLSFLFLHVRAYGTRL